MPGWLGLGAILCWLCFAALIMIMIMFPVWAPFMIFLARFWLAARPKKGEKAGFAAQDQAYDWPKVGA